MIRLYLAPDEFGSGGTATPITEQAQGQEPSTPVAVPAADHPGSSSCEWR
jgi:hypothetical protein